MKLKRAVPKDLERGTQIVYIPTHLQDKYRDGDGDILHDVLSETGVEAGFVTSVTPQGPFCRFWLTVGGGGDELRTKSNSERAAYADVFLLKTRTVKQVTAALKSYC